MKYEKMESDLKNKWLAALRSGNYRQGQCNLRTGDYEGEGPLYHCCLGVLADVVDPLGWTCDDSWRFEWGTPGILSEHLETKISVMNDRGATFEQIADWIENNL